MTFDIRTVDLDKLNSLTKYPSILTYHTLDPTNGSLLDETVPFVGEVIGTEKIDGVNGRIILLPDGSYVIGSRDELLHAKGDVIANPALGIVEQLRPVAESLVSGGDYGLDLFQVYYVEVYGGRKITSASRNYTGDGNVGHRFFDVFTLPNYADILAWPRDRIASWRQHGGQPFHNEGDLWFIENVCDGVLRLTPRLFTVNAAELPTEIDKMRDFLIEYLPKSLVPLDDKATSRPEGIVFRSANRALIAKARFQDYDRTIRIRAGGRR